MKIITVNKRTRYHACDVGPTVDDEDAFAALLRLLGEHRAVQPRAYDEVVVHNGNPLMGYVIQT